MLLRKIALILVTLAFFVPTAAIAGDIDVQAGNVRVTTDAGGKIKVNSGSTRLSVPSDRRQSIHNSRLRNTFRNSWNNPHINKPVRVQSTSRISCGRGRSSSSYQSSQITSSNKRVVQRSVSTNTCL